jgi:hypothetical protein
MTEGLERESRGNSASPSSKRCNASREKRAATSSTPKKSQKGRLKPGISRLPRDNPALSDHLPGDNVQNHLILQGFSRWQKSSHTQLISLAFYCTVQYFSSEKSR